MKFVFIIAIVLFTNPVQGQTRKNFPPPAVTSKYSDAQRADAGKCAYRRRFSNAQLLEQFPFNATKRIELVAFENSKLSAFDSSIGQRVESRSLLRKSGYNDNKRCYDTVTIQLVVWIEKKVLDSSEELALANLIFNYRNKKDLDEVMTFNSTKEGCYYPRNAILFYGPTDNIIAAIEICFECNAIEAMPDDLYLGEPCHNRFDLFRAFVSGSGIKYGVVKN